MSVSISTQMVNAYNLDLATRPFTDNGSRMQFHLESIRRACTVITNDDNQDAGVQSNCMAVISKINHILRNDMTDKDVVFYAMEISWIYQTFSNELWFVKAMGHGNFQMWQEMMKHGILPMISNA